jgi:hypothetical protein
VTALLLIWWEQCASGHWPVTVDKIGGRPLVGNDRTGAACVAELGPTDMRLPFIDLQFPCRAAPQRQHMWRIIFQANFELHPYDVEI